MTELLIGSNVVGTVRLGEDTLYFLQAVALWSGRVSQFHLYAKANGHAKVAMYADNGGSVGALLSTNNESQDCVADQWNILTLPVVGIVQGTAYWFAAIADVTGVITRNGLGTGGIKVGYNYGTFTFPASVTGITSSEYSRAFAGWEDRKTHNYPCFLNR
jgi:hypothetical protein